MAASPFSSLPIPIPEAYGNGDHPPGSEPSLFFTNLSPLTLVILLLVALIIVLLLKKTKKIVITYESDEY